MRNIEDGSFIGGEQIEQALFKLALQVRIESRERFVEHEDRGLGGEHARERHALLLTTGKLQGVALLQPAKPEARELTLDERITVLLEHLARNARCDIRLHGKVREELVILEQQRALAFLRRKIHGCLLARSLVEIRLAIHDDLTCIRRFNTGDAAQCERLATPRGAQEAERFVRRFKGNFQIEGAVVLLDVDHQTHTTILRRALAPEVDREDHREGDDDHHDRPEERRLDIATHPFEVDGDGDGARDTCIVARQKERCAELTERACEGEHGAGSHGRPGKRQHESEEDASFAPAERAGSIEHIGIDRLEGAACRAIHEREGHDHRCDNGRLPAEDEREPDLVEPCANGGVASQEHEQQEATDRGW